MSSKRIPGEGKSGYWRRALFSLTLRLVSSAALAVAAAESRREALGCSVGSGWDGGGWDEVESFAVAGLVDEKGPDERPWEG